MVAGVLTAVGAHAWADRYLRERGTVRAAEAVGCQQPGRDHLVIIKQNAMHPARITAQLCDQLTIVNQDDRLRKIAFGEHDRHLAYDGFSEKLVRSGQQFSITFNRVGTYHFHDHFQAATAGDFTVTR